MKLGFGLITCQRYPGDPRSDEELYAQAIELATLVEDVGFDSVWVSEHHFVDDAYLPSLLPLAAAIAARTSRIEIGTGLLLAPLHEPLRLAEDAAVVDLISRGRFILGLGLGWRPEEFAALHVPLEERATRLEDTIAVLRQAWSGAPVEGGSLLRYPGVYVTPTPSRPGGPPIWVGALAERAVRRAGRIADGLMATNVTPSSLALQVSWAREEHERLGRDADGLTVSVHLPTFPWAGSAEGAWERVLPLHRYVAWKYDDMEVAHGRAGPPPSPPPLAPGEESTLRSGIMLGSPERVAEQILALDRAAGGGLHFIARLYWPGLDPSLQEDVIHLWSERVAPLLR